jgi:transcriptional regulator with XRE-family HTH domain
MPESSLSEYLRTTINEYLKKKSHSLITLSDKSGIHYNTLARILKGRVESPSLETTLGILKVCQTGPSAFAALRRYFPDYDVILGMIHSDRGGEQPSGIDLERVLADDVVCRIIALARTRDGVTVDAVRQYCGEMGLERLRVLLEQEWLLAEGSILRVNTAKLGGDLKLSLEFLRALGAILRQEQHRRDDALMWNQVERFNAEGMKALRSAAMDFFHEVESIKNNPMYQGDMVCFTGAMVGGFDFSQSSDESMH